MKKILLVDNADSFVYNLAEFIRGEEGFTFEVVSSSNLTIEHAYNIDSVILSPGAGLPSNYPQMIRLIEAVKYTHPILGICLGHQAICTYFGGELEQLAKPKHGHTSFLQRIDIQDKLLQKVEEGCAIGRYHSWVVKPDTLPAHLRVTSYDDDDNIMSIRHCELPIYGLQFHPESIISEQGIQILKNFLAL